jgi:hypothetical protein
MPTNPWVDGILLVMTLSGMKGTGTQTSLEITYRDLLYRDKTYRDISSLYRMLRSFTYGFPVLVAPLPRPSNINLDVFVAKVAMPSNTIVGGLKKPMLKGTHT